MLDDILRARRETLRKLREKGIDPYPARSGVTHAVSGVLASFEALVASRERVTLGGRLLALRNQGGILFADLNDGSGKLQLLVSSEKLNDFEEVRGFLDIGDIIQASGTLTTTARGEKSLDVSSVRLLVKSLRPLPSVWHGLEDVEERYRRRYLDIMLNDEVRRDLLLRSEVVRTLREKLAHEGFIEVETPILQPIAGGAIAAPFSTHHNALDVDFYLRIAPELYLKRLLVAGFSKIFEIGRVFRNEGVDREHSPEFSMLELYWAYQDYHGLMDFVERLLSRWIPGPYERASYDELMREYAGVSVDDLDPEKIDEVFKREVRPRLSGPLFMTGHPKTISPLAKSSAENPERTERFQLIVHSMEVVNGFSELNDPIDQRERMEEQERRFRAGDPEASRLDEEFLEALEYGMPPAAGLGIGIDRLVGIITGKPVKETIIFPTLRPRRSE